MTGPNRVNRFVRVAPTLLDLIVDRIEPNERVMAGQRAVLPCLDFRDQLVSYGPDRGIGNLKPVDFSNLPRDVQIAHAQPEQRDDLALDLVAHMSLLFLH